MNKMDLKSIFERNYWVYGLFNYFCADFAEEEKLRDLSLDTLF